LSDLFDAWVENYHVKWAVASTLQPRSFLEVGVRFGYRRWRGCGAVGVTRAVTRRSAGRRRLARNGPAVGSCADSLIASHGDSLPPRLGEAVEPNAPLGTHWVHEISGNDRKWPVAQNAKAEVSGGFR
jgi:hypothetical protein